MEQRGASINENAIVYKVLFNEMVKAGYRPCNIAREMGVAPNTILRKMKDQRAWCLWECLEIKTIIKSTMTIEELFAKG